MTTLLVVLVFEVVNDPRLLPLLTVLLMVVVVLVVV
jgi:hypothetical protein